MTEEKMFCPECGNECLKIEKYCGNCGAAITTAENGKKQDNMVKNRPIISNFMGTINYLIWAVVILIITGIGLSFSYMYWIEEFSKNDDTIFLQIYHQIETVSVTFGLGISIICGFTIAFAFFALFRFNTIQKHIVETQDLICKHLNVVNERFNKLENKE